MIKKPESIHFHKPVATAIYLSALGVIISLLILFADILYRAYEATESLQFTALHHIILGLLIIVIALLVILIVTGKIGYKELSYLQKYKLKIEH